MLSAINCNANPLSDGTYHSSKLLTRYCVKQHSNTFAARQRVQPMVSRMMRLEGGLRRRLYLNEVEGRSTGPRRRARDVMSSTSHRGGRALLTY